MVRSDVADPIENTLEPTFGLKLFSECLGTFGLSYTVAMTAASTDSGGLAPVAVPVCAACYLILMVYGIGSVSGCHINPGVSTAVFGWQWLSETNDSWLIEWFSYVVVQCIGGTCGSMFGVMLWLASGKYDQFNAYGIFPYVGANESPMAAMFTEMLALFFFTFCILRVCCDHDKPPLATDGLVIGIALFTAIVGTASVSGGGVNPAVATSLLMANGYLQSIFDLPEAPHTGFSFIAVYWIGPFLGAFLAAIAHYLIESMTSKVFVPYAFLHDSDRFHAKKNDEEI